MALIMKLSLASSTSAQVIFLSTTAFHVVAGFNFVVLFNLDNIRDHQIFPFLPCCLGPHLGCWSPSKASHALLLQPDGFYVFQAGDGLVDSLSSVPLASCVDSVAHPNGLQGDIQWSSPQQRCGGKASKGRATSKCIC